MDRTLEVSPAFDIRYGTFLRRIILASDVEEYCAAMGVTSLPRVDRFGYEIAYFVGKLSEDDFATFAAAVDADTYDGGPISEPLVNINFDGDVLCGDCAGKFGSMSQPLEVLYVTYQINGEVGDAETVFCDHCSFAIYDPYVEDEPLEDEDDDIVGGW
jgi:hypothetical protein